MALTVTNTGSRSGTEVIQLYAADTVTGVVLPAQQLVGFARVELEPGETRRVRFGLPLSVLAYPGLDGELIMEPGPVELSAGSSSNELRSALTVTVVGEAQRVRPDERAFFSSATVEGAGG